MATKQRPNRATERLRRTAKGFSRSLPMAYTRQVELDDLSNTRPLRPRNTGYTPRESLLSPSLGAPSLHQSENKQQEQELPKTSRSTPRRRPSPSSSTACTTSVMPARSVRRSSIVLPPPPIAASTSAPQENELDKATAQLNQVLSQTQRSEPSTPNKSANITSPPSPSTPRSNIVNDEISGASTESICPEQREDLFRNCLSASSVDVDELRRLVWAHGLPSSSSRLKSSAAPWIRPLAWKLLTGYLPPDRSDWAAALTTARAHYWALVHDATVDPSARPVDGDHPLSDEDTSQWREFFQDADIREFISRDARRTHPELDPDEEIDMTMVREALERILFVYAKTREGLGYRQGMNELAAPFLIVFFAEDHNYAHNHNHGYMNGNGGNMGIRMDASDVEADAYFCFQAIMNEMETCYVKDSHSSGITKQLRELQALLRIKDPQLEARLEDLGIDPRFYGLRWLRLWVSREFKLHDSLALWDSFLTAEVRLPWIRYVCVAMLIRIRDTLLEGDFTKCMKSLLHYPECNITQLLRIADELRTSNAVIVRTARS